jgi:O-acetyl-ADP-ribose deacetylase (regulator of RNase III)
MTKIEVKHGDITQMEVDAIVNAANNQLVRGGGVCGAIHRAAGPDLEAECLTLGGCDTGDAKTTDGHQLPADYVIHAVGPVWHGGSNQEPQLLASAYRRSLEEAEVHNVRTLAFPAISCGVFGYPVEQAASVAVETINDFLAQHQLPEKVYLVCFSEQDTATCQEALEKLS